MVDGSSLLLDLDGVVVESVQRLEDGTRLVQVLTAPQWVGICPDCGERSTRSKGWVATGPRDVQVGPDRPLLRWRKRKWLCPSTVCERKVFTGSVPGVPARARVTPRAKAMWVDRWDTGLVDITGDQGLLGQVNGRNSAVVIDWLAHRDPAWRAAITHVAIDLSTVYARVAREALPGAMVIADRFHVVKKANDIVDAAARP